MGKLYSFVGAHRPHSPSDRTRPTTTTGVFGDATPPGGRVVTSLQAPVAFTAAGRLAIWKLCSAGAIRDLVLIRGGRSDPS